MDAAEISRRMAKIALEVCQHLLPGGVAISGEYHVGSTAGERGKGKRGEGSCRIHIRDDGKAGVWTDFSGEKGGDLITLWMKVKQADFITAIREIRAHFGWETPEQERFTKKKADYRRPTWKEIQSKQIQPIVPRKGPANPPPPVPDIEQQSPVMAYLLGKRCLTWETLALFRVWEKPPGERGPKESRIPHGWTICFPYFRSDSGREPPVNVKYVELERSKSGGKIEWQEWNAEPCLFGWQAITPNDSYVVLTEGEIDAMSWVQAGVPALSIPMGSGGGDKQLKWIENEYDYLERFMRIYICFDRDKRPETDDPVELEKWEKKVKAVQDAVAVIASRLGHHRCLQVNLPPEFKDPNEALQKGWFTPKNARKLLDTARWLDPDLLKPAEVFFDDVRQRFAAQRGVQSDQGDDQKLIGYRPHWAAAARARVLVELGKVLIVHGLSHHGKSEFVRFTEIHAANQGFRVCKASLEESPGEQLWKQCQQIAAATDVDDCYLEDIKNWMTGKFWIYNLVGQTTLTSILDVYAYAHKRYGCNLFVIDSMTMLELEQSGKWKEDKNEAQTELVRRVVNFTRQYGVIVCLVCHDTDPDQDQDGCDLPPGKNKIRGVKTIGDMVHDIWLVYRDERKRIGKGPGKDNPTKGRTVLMVQKNKLFGHMPIVPFVFHESRQFLLENQQAAPFISASTPPGQQPLKFERHDSDGGSEFESESFAGLNMESEQTESLSQSLSSLAGGYTFDPDMVGRDDE